MRRPLRNQLGVVSAAVLASMAGLFATGCDPLNEQHCRSGEIVIREPSGGSHCAPRGPRDRACAHGQVLERQPAQRRERCIPSALSKRPDPDTPWLPITGD